jgi:hypothetical protein
VPNQAKELPRSSNNKTKRMKLMASLIPTRLQCDGSRQQQTTTTCLFSRVVLLGVDCERVRKKKDVFVSENDVVEGIQEPLGPLEYTYMCGKKSLSHDINTYAIIRST